MTTLRQRVDPRTGEVNVSPHIRPFADWLVEQAGGKTANELSESLWDLVARVGDTHKRGSLMLTITVEPMKENPDVLVISDEIKLKLPEFNRPGSVAYVDHNGNLTRENPNQPALSGLQVVEPINRKVG